MPGFRISSLSAEAAVTRGMNVDELNSWVAHHRSGDWFTSELFRLWKRSDARNRDRMRRGFPEECAIFEAWYNQVELRERRQP